MNSIKKTLANFLTGNNAWILLVVLVLISYHWVLTVVIYNSSRVYLAMPKWILFFQFLGAITLLFGPFLLFCLFRKWVKLKTSQYTYYTIWATVFVVYPSICFGLLEWNKYIMPVKMESEVMWMIAIVLIVVELLTAPSTALKINADWSRLKSFFTTEPLVISIYLILCIYSTIQLIIINKAEGGFFMILLQCILLNSMAYLFYRVNHYFLVSEIFYKKGIIYYAFAFIGVCIVFYIPIILVHYYLPGFKTMLSFRAGADHWVGDNPPLAFYAISKGTVASLLIFTIPIIIIVQWYTQATRITNLEKEKSETELNLLKQQINPHFFFNTLNNVYSMSLTHDERTSEGILQLADLMRYVIYKGQESTVALSDELKYIEDFLELQKMRLHQNFDLQFDKDIQNENTKITPLLFIILVENAFKHGIEGAEKESFLYLSLKQIDGLLTFNCINSIEEDDRGKVAGLGLQNLRRRLELIYPERHTLILERRENSYYASLSIQLNNASQ